MDESMHRLTADRALDKFVSGDWPFFARFAYQSFQDMGRGFVFIDGREDTPKGSTVHFHTVKALTKAEVRDALATAGIDVAQVIDLVQDYDPEKMIVVVYATNNWGAVYHAKRKAPRLASGLKLPRKQSLGVIRTFALDPPPVTFRHNPHP